MADYIPKYKPFSEAKYSFIVSTFGLQTVRTAFFNVPPTQMREWNPTGDMGTPVWDNVILQDREENPEVQLRVDTVLIEASLPKIIKKTPIQGRRGRVKEYISEDDWQIVIRGALFSEDKDRYPEDISKLVELSRLPHELVIVSKYLNDFCDVSNIVIDRIKMPQKAGGIQKQAFELRCSSDLPYELQEEEE